MATDSEDCREGFGSRERGGGEAAGEGRRGRDDREEDDDDDDDGGRKRRRREGDDGGKRRTRCTNNNRNNFATKTLDVQRRARRAIRFVREAARTLRRCHRPIDGGRRRSSREGDKNEIAKRRRKEKTGVRI